jgi:hypothetical protein
MTSQTGRLCLAKGLNQSTVTGQPIQRLGEQKKPSARLHNYTALPQGEMGQIGDWGLSPMVRRQQNCPQVFVKRLFCMI